MSNIKFGTDGWRAVVGEDFNEENVALVSKAIGKYVLTTMESIKLLLSVMTLEIWQKNFLCNVRRF